MIIDVEEAFINYFDSNMVSVVGHGNNSIGLYRGKFPDDALDEGIAVYAELRESHESVCELENIGLRIMVRTTDRKHTFYLAQNVDDLIDRYVCKNLDDSVELCVARRNSGPTFFDGENDGFYYAVTLYTITVRYKGNDDG